MCFIVLEVFLSDLFWAGSFHDISTLLHSYSLASGLVTLGVEVCYEELLGGQRCASGFASCLWHS